MNLLRAATFCFSRPIAVLALVLLAAAWVRAQESRLANLSTLATTGSGATVLAAGFVIGPGPSKQVLIRAVGPTLGTAFGVPGSLADPVLTVFNASNATVARNDNWLAVDAATFAAVGAFALPTNSRDSALVVTLAPGNYTAQVTSASISAPSGAALVEVYELPDSTGASARLINTSTSLQVTAGAVPIIGFVVTPGTGTRKFLLRASGPALAPFGVAGTLSDPSLALNSSAGAILATNDNWSTPVGATASSATTLSSAFAAAGAFAFPAGSRDAALLVDLAPGNYGLQLTGVGGGSGISLVEVYDVSPSGPPTVTIAATKSTADESGANPGEFTVSRSGDTLSALTVNYGVGGTATNSLDYPVLLGSVTITIGASSVKIPLNPLPDTLVESTETVVLTLLAGTGYTIGTAATATVTIADSASTLYVAALRPAGAAVVGSTAFGTATIIVSASGTVASVNVAFSNLSSAEVSAHLTLGANDDFVFNLPNGQVTGAQWTFTPTGTYTATALLDALKSGNISVRIDTAKFPSGEARGAFLLGAGSQTFSAPPAAPAVALTKATATDAARFLMQATFGPRQSEIDALTGGDLGAWLTAQLALPFTSHRAATVLDFATFDGVYDVTFPIAERNRQAAWWKIVLGAPDQLRQRAAFALSELLVVSDATLGHKLSEGVSNYYDILGTHAFGNFRTLLTEITLNPIMGTYLSSLRNAKADPVAG
ncbi:MAG: hypothetical protein RLZZ15_3454, partial [Verrucomicrobiota bacterium]